MCSSFLLGLFSFKRSHYFVHSCVQMCHWSLIIQVYNNVNKTNATCIIYSLLLSKRIKATKVQVVSFSSNLRLFPLQRWEKTAREGMKVKESDVGIINVELSSFCRYQSVQWETSSLNFQETRVLRRWGSTTRKHVFINAIDDVKGLRCRDWKSWRFAGALGRRQRESRNSGSCVFLHRRWSHAIGGNMVS